MTLKIKLNDKYSYLRNAARYAGDTESWFRYLGKHIKDNIGMSISKLEQILDDIGLSVFQKQTLVSALSKGTFLNTWLHSRYTHLPLTDMEEIKNRRKSIIEMMLNQGDIQAYSEKAFEALNDKLNEAGEMLEITCVGGYVLALNGIRNTHDIDAIYTANSKVSSLIHDVGEDLDINLQDEDWLNCHVMNTMEDISLPVGDDKILKYNLSNLKVYVASPLYVLGMKLNPTVFGTRITDNDDVVDLIKNNPDWDIQEVYARLKKYQFKVSPSDLFSAFFMALGTTWYSGITRKFGANAMQDFIETGKFKT